MIATGGTIAGGVDASTGKMKLLSARELLESVKEVRATADMRFEDFSNVGSSRITPEMQSELSNRISQVLAGEEDAVIVTHGTDSLEETAFFLELTVPSEKPVVMTAAQRPPASPDSDGPRNLMNAVRISVAQEAKERGVMVTLNDEIHSARYVRKTHTIALESFKSGQKGMLGYVDGGKVIFYYRPEPRTVFHEHRIDSKVDLIKLAAGSDTKFIQATVEKSSSGLVVEAFGRGNIPPKVLEALFDARRRGLMVVITSRCFEGRTVIPNEWREEGLICGHDLDGLKARILLMLCLGLKKDVTETQTLFDRIYGGH